MADSLGIHHVTAICGDPQRNLDFYAGMLGLRFVKRTVNFDDPETYHFYYGDGHGTPGSILTFFPWPGARPGRIGPGQVAVTGFAVIPGAIGFWVQRLIHYGVKFRGPERRELGAGVAETVLAFPDPDGLLLEIVGAPDAEARPGWDGAPGIRAADALRGFHAVTLWHGSSAPTADLLKTSLGFRELGEQDGIRRFAAGDGGSGTLVNLRPVGGFPAGVGGVGTVHHVAWRVADDAAQLEVRGRVEAAGLAPTPVIDRQYFHSVYFREPGGVLFELATDPPGFTVDEPLDRLGERLMLPPQFETRRIQLEAILPPIRLPGAALPADATSAADDPGGPEGLGFVHRHLPPGVPDTVAHGTTLLLLHGTGGDEDDLVPLGRRLLPGAALLSPRGKVLERGMPRFFRRIAEGVFDQEDLARRTEELAEFVAAAVQRYGLHPERVVAVGFSNGANIAASLLLRRPGLLRGAVLLSPMVPFEPASSPSLTGTTVFIGAGRSDTISPPDQAEQLAMILRRAGAEVTVHWDAGGHALHAGTITAARAWLERMVEQVPEDGAA